MAYSILSNLTSNKFYPATNHITSVVNSSNNGNCNFRYVADIYINNIKVFTQKQFPDPVTGNGIFQIDHIVRDYINNTIPKTPYTTYFNLASGSTAPTSLLAIYVRFGEEYDLSAGCDGLVTSYLNLAQTNTAYAYNGAVSYEDYPSYTYTNYVATWASASVATKFLSNSPTNISISYNDSYYLDFLSLSSPTVYSSPSVGNVAIELTRNYKDGSAATTWYNATALSNNKRFRIAVGPYDFNGTENTPIISQYVRDYTVRLVWRFGNNTLHYLSETITFTVKKPQQFNTRFAWINQLGGIDQYTFYQRDRKTYKVERNMLKKSLLQNYSNNFTYQVGDRQNVVYNIDVVENHKCSTFVSEEEAIWMANDLYLTKDAWVYSRPECQYYEMYREDYSNPYSRMLLKAKPNHGIVAGQYIFVMPDFNTNNTPMLARHFVYGVSGSNIDIGVTYDNFAYPHGGYFYADTNWAMLPIIIDTQEIPEKQKTGKRIIYEIDYHMGFDKNIIN